MLKLRSHCRRWLAPIGILVGLQVFVAVSVSDPAAAQQAPAAEVPAAQTPVSEMPANTLLGEVAQNVDGYLLGPNGEVLLGPDGQPLMADAEDGLPPDLSPWGMFVAADWVVKSVMIGLAIASVITWTVWLVTSLELRAARRRAQAARATLAEVSSLATAVTALQSKMADRRACAARDLLSATAHEVELSAGLPAEGIEERVASRLERIEATAQRQITRGTGILATIGSTAPFVGLFGTVWGIMNSFIRISEAQTTNLAVVAPGIAEALLATALGLVAAIPAVVIYNKFARAISGYRALLADISAELLRLVSRDLDQRRGSFREAAE